MEVLPGTQLVTWPSLVPIFFGHVDIMSFATNPLMTDYRQPDHTVSFPYGKVSVLVDFDCKAMLVYML